jgi:hypothetical protein
MMVFALMGPGLSERLVAGSIICEFLFEPFCRDAPHISHVEIDG